MHLSAYMELAGLSDDQVAAKIERSRVTVSRIRRKKVRPDWATIEALYRISDGAITANDFQSIEETTQ